MSKSWACSVRILTSSMPGSKLPQITYSEKSRRSVLLKKFVNKNDYCLSLQWLHNTIFIWNIELFMEYSPRVYHSHFIFPIYKLPFFPVTIIPMWIHLTFCQNTLKVLPKAASSNKAVYSGKMFVPYDFVVPYFFPGKLIFLNI